MGDLVRGQTAGLYGMRRHFPDAGHERALYGVRRTDDAGAAAGGVSGAPCVDLGMDGRMHTPVTADPAVPDLAAASAAAARACYNLALRRAMAGDDRPPGLPGPAASGAAGCRDSGEADGPVHAFEPSPPFHVVPFA